MSIRKASYEDLKDVYEIETLSFKYPYPYSLLVSLFIIAQDTFLVAELEGKIVGYIIGLMREKRLGHIVSLAVHPKFRRKGIGRMLITKLLQLLK